jgi:hypothetical protein
MKLSDLVSALSPTHLTQISLLLFLAVFVAVAIRHGSKKRAAEHAACAALPLENDQ